MLPEWIWTQGFWRQFVATLFGVFAAFFLNRLWGFIARINRHRRRWNELSQVLDSLDTAIEDILCRIGDIEDDLDKGDWPWDHALSLATWRANQEGFMELDPPRQVREAYTKFFVTLERNVRLLEMDHREDEGGGRMDDARKPPMHHPRRENLANKVRNALSDLETDGEEAMETSLDPWWRTLF